MTNTDCLPFPLHILSYFFVFYLILLYYYFIYGNTKHWIMPKPSNITYILISCYILFLFLNNNYHRYFITTLYLLCVRHAVSQLVEALHYKPEGRGFAPDRSHRIFRNGKIHSTQYDRTRMDN
jgi:hypothetical protein